MLSGCQQYQLRQAQLAMVTCHREPSAALHASCPWLSVLIRPMFQLGRLSLRRRERHMGVPGSQDRCRACSVAHADSVLQGHCQVPHFLFLRLTDKLFHWPDPAVRKACPVRPHSALTTCSLPGPGPSPVLDLSCSSSVKWGLSGVANSEARPGRNTIGWMGLGMGQEAVGGPELKAMHLFLKHSDSPSLLPTPLLF